MWEFELILINVLLKHYSGLNGNDYAICCIYAKNSLKFKIICLYDLKKKKEFEEFLFNVECMKKM